MYPYNLTLDALDDLPANADLQLRPAVYVIVAPDGKSVNYVGQTGSAFLRLADHRRTKKWFTPECKVKVLWENDPETRLIAETVLILRMRPRFNRAIKLGLTKTGGIYELNFLRSGKG